MRALRLLALSICSFLLIASISAAQLGEVAGQPHFNVSIGSSNTLTVTVTNQAQYPLPIKVILPTLMSNDANAITPGVAASPMAGNIPAEGQLQINVTVYMPGGTNMPGYTWTGIMQVLAVPANSSSSGGMGASILAGVAKVITVTATEGVHATKTYDYITPLGIAAIIVASAGLLAAYRRKGRKRVAEHKRIIRGQPAHRQKGK